MYYCMYYWPITPLRSQLKDNPERLPAFTTKLVLPEDAGTLDVALFCDEQGLPEFGRLTIPQLTEQSIPPELFPQIRTFKEHLLTVMRLTYREDVAYALAEFHSFFVEGERYELSLVTEITDSRTLIPGRVAAAFQHSYHVEGTDATVCRRC